MDAKDNHLPECEGKRGSCELDYRRFNIGTKASSLGFEMSGKLSLGAAWSLHVHAQLNSVHKINEVNQAAPFAH